MPVNLTAPTVLLPIAGVRLATAASAMRYKNRDDLVLIELDPAAEVAAVFTQNKFRAPPVELASANLHAATPRYLIINAGNANAGSGVAGMHAAEQTCLDVAEQCAVNANQVLPFSTGVIGELLDSNKIKVCLTDLQQQLSEDNWLQAAAAILTTDIVAKGQSKQVLLQGKMITITGMTKGSGMIQPNMATMLAYVATDLAIPKDVLERLLKETVEQSFNAITVDSDTSTNDACVLIASASAALNYDDLNDTEQLIFETALLELMQTLAQSIIRDGEGATKFVSVEVATAADKMLAKKVAMSIANSPLVKTALAASDANWGRILAAAGKVESDELNLANASLTVNDIVIWKDGSIHSSYTEEKGKQAFMQDEIKLLIDLNDGSESFTVWTCDLTHEYIRINAEYRS
ncbi:MAG: bifunctional glutamate N-acetyltransferase/amino-acid acetyltransferase ArgJ [Gammaproteobacteria bacterium]|nr:bifunctional glutamate N-acetyltransferase/amino-acid acetyltransferase ArgJ [Gammaproteobacteria bacterium]